MSQRLGKNISTRNGAHDKNLPNLRRLAKSATAIANTGRRVVPPPIRMGEDGRRPGVGMEWGETAGIRASSFLRPCPP
jgi:hypothetical protein